MAVTILNVARHHRYGESGTGWLMVASLIALVVLMPVISLLWHAGGGTVEHWQHLAKFVLPQALYNSVFLLLGVGVGVVFWGTTTAWCVTAYDFPGHRVLGWALLLPLAVPTYIVAFAYLDVLHPIGPVQTWLRGLLGYTSPREFRLPDLRSLPGAIFVMTFVLYPYVYLSTRAMFATQAAAFMEAARTLGCTSRQVFYRVALPMARPAIVAGASLALLEALNDIGAAEFLGVRTLTVSVYTTWITRSDLAGAAQIALAMLIIVVALVLLERMARKRQRYAATQSMRPMSKRPLRGVKGALMCLFCATPFFLGFVVPALYLLSETVKRLRQVAGVSDQLLASAANTVMVAAVATVATVLCGLAVAWAARRLRESAGTAWRSAVRVASLGYAIPGTVLAIGLLIPLAWLDEGLGDAAAWFGGDVGLLITGSMAALVIAYTIRFLAIAIGGIEAGLERLPVSLEQASRLLGETPAGTLRRVHLPLLRPAMAAAMLLVFVDTMKELPATLLLRPLGFETLSSWLYAEAVRGTYEEGAVAALLIVMIGLLPVILLSRWKAGR
jgi:iron(III) transport system permease protein